MVASTNDLKNYILKNLNKGYEKNSLKIALIKQGYSKTSIERAIEKAEKEISNKKDNSTEKTKKPIIKHSLFDENNKVVKVEYFPKKSFFKRLFKK